MIYFIQRPDNKLIKIGTTIRLSERLKALCAEAGDDLVVLAVADGSFDQERALHQRFGHLRVFGEWFEPGSDLLGFIVSEGSPWDRSRQMEEQGALPQSVKVDRTLAFKAKMVASQRGITMAEYISELIRPSVERDFAKAVREIDEPKKGKGLPK